MAEETCSVLCQRLRIWEHRIPGSLEHLHTAWHEIQSRLTKTRIQSQTNEILVYFPILSLFLLACLTLLSGARSTPLDPVVCLVTSTIAWALILLVSAVLVWFQTRRQNLPFSDTLHWITTNEANVAVCILLGQICSASGGPLAGWWSFSLLPIAIIVATLLSPVNGNQKIPIGVIATTALATLFSVHCALSFQFPSIELLLCIFESIFLSKAMLFFERVAEDAIPATYQKIEEGSLSPPEDPSIRFLFLVPLRNISLLLTISLTICTISLSIITPSIGLPAGSLHDEFVGAFQELVRWSLICSLLWQQRQTSSAIARTLAVSSLLALLYQCRTQHLLALESCLAIFLLLSYTVSLSWIRARMRLVMWVGIFLCVVIVLILLGHRLASLPRESIIAQDEIIRQHPIELLIQRAREEFDEILERQSKTLQEAVDEYKFRTGMHPPPKFDEWFAFATERDFRLIDEFDNIHHLMKPFWGMRPATIRQYARDAIGAENSPYTRFRIRDGRLIRSHGGWFEDPMTELLEKLAPYLPDMELPLNPYDEPSVVVPHDLLEQLVATETRRTENPRNNFSSPPSDLEDDIPSHYGTNVLSIGHQTIWSHVIHSCPLDSPVRNTTAAVDATDKYARDPLGFIYNHTAFTEVCNQPSLPLHHGFFDRPVTLHLVSVPWPIFSVSKPSVFNDILIPSASYYGRRVGLDERQDIDWDKKRNGLHWRGATNSGFITHGGLTRQHRQRFVSAFDKINHPVPILKKADDHWVKDTMSPERARSLFDVKFSRISEFGTPEAREEETRVFDIAEHEDQQELWKWKFLLDLDGHGLSGRFYAMMMSNSLVFKCAMFREWHDDWLKPWVHYVPLGLDGTDWFEAVRYFALDENGQNFAPEIAKASSEWAKMVLRKEDMETWTFRMLLEYARVIDDNRDSLGFEIQERQI